MGRGHREQLADLAAVDAESGPRNRVEHFVAGEKQPLQGTDARVVMVTFDARDGRLRDPGPDSQGTLR